MVSRINHSGLEIVVKTLRVKFGNKYKNELSTQNNITTEKNFPPDSVLRLTF